MGRARFLTFGFLGFVGLLLIRISFSVYSSNQNHAALLAVALLVFGGSLLALGIGKIRKYKRESQKLSNHGREEV